MSSAPIITAFFDEATNSVSYLVADAQTKSALVIDPVLDFDPASGAITTRSADRVLDAATQQRLTIEWVLETHAHADHMSAAGYLRERTGAMIGIGGGIMEVQKVFSPLLQ